MFGAAAALVCALLGVAQLGTAVWTAQALWLAAMAIPVFTLLGERLARWWPWRSARPGVPWRELGLLTLVFGVALAVRVPAISASPPFVHGDEAVQGLWGRLFDRGQAPLLSIGWFGPSMLSYAIPGLGLHLFGDTLTGLRLTNAVVGSVSVVLAYLLVWSADQWRQTETQPGHRGRSRHRQCGGARAAASSPARPLD
jgi:hypothetical protein